jgi:hypothetical protein
MSRAWVSLYYIIIFEVKNWDVFFIYSMKNYKISHFEKFKTIIKGSIQCHNVRIKVFDPSLTNMCILTIY